MRIKEQSSDAAVAAARKAFMHQIEKLESLMNYHPIEYIESAAFRK